MISIILPTKGNPSGLFECVYAINNLASDVKSVEIILVVDEDDATMKDFYGPNNCHIVKVPPGLNMGELNNAGAEQASGKLLVAMNDDCFVRTQDWDKKFVTVCDKYRDGIVLFWPDDTIFGPRLSCFFGLTRRVYEICGEFGPREFKKYSIDPFIYTTFLELRNKGHNRLCYCPNVVFEHMNKSEVSPGVFDYAGGNAELQAQDEAVFRSLLGRMQNHVEKMHEAIIRG